MMFSSPNVRALSQENSQSVISRKPGQNTLSRIPFCSIAVNSTPAKSPLQKQKQNVKLHDKLVAPKTEKIPIDDYMFSYKEEKDNFEDIWPGYDEKTNSKMICNDLRAFCGRPKTPEPEINFDIDSIFFDVPEPPLYIPEHLEEKLPEFNNSFDSIDIPPIDFDEFNDSV